MAHNPTQLVRIQQAPVPTTSAQASCFWCATVDTAAQVLAAGYFNDARHKLKVGDTIIVKAGIGGTRVTLFLDVTAAPASGNVTTAAIDPQLGGLPAVLTENGGAIGGSSDGDLPALVASVTLGWNGSAYPTAQQATDINAALAAAVAGIRENATKINAIITALGS